MFVPQIYWLGVVVFYFGCAYCLYESLPEPALRKNRVARVGLAVFSVSVGSWISVTYTFARTPLEFDSYVINDSDSGEVSGIPWSTHFTDLRVWVNNKTENDYGGVKIDITPNTWAYRAEIIGDKHGCELKRIGKGRHINIEIGRAHV